MTSIRLMRSLRSSARSSRHVIKSNVVAAAAQAPPSCNDPQSCWNNCNRDICFNSSAPRSSLPPSQQGDHKPPDERTIQLGKTVRTLHERLPTLLKEPLPSDILSPSITLHLFPSTHPHLPTVSGRIAYIAALWTAPVAWGRMPLIGNVQLVILSERMVRNGGSAVPLANREEKLIVKWKTCGKTTHRDGTGGIYRGMGLAAARDPVDKIKGFISGKSAEPEERKRDAEEFCGIFIFEFDEKGRLAKHTIEHTEEGGDYDRMTRVVSVTEWLLSRFNGKKKEDMPALAWCEERPAGGGMQLVDRRPRY
ncbi:hypothetical protein CLAFUW4_02994 [Fulvia fulva]|uniref:Uncharacterized protein n=1 Tax=Passalora fulva TaxID=5499 RepID=A0A9Q8P636_PASFU|nr:uncharacterized protein CLAFUR5_02979 [Fulvia fulva]KAK4632113.1 hypothetical protein CLAFUR4_02987 [Fulvia fulva]KAK4632696.1 hypothetical protein CLAFUR0_02990 [Fulvia fulva]UJO14638.1 hypothetical protein CLAFUR5_02979 [Fulvia fulva]WPV11727.1 hypothetical protein CLAFUW4_02994 [Fulvia fulva]WPV25589.1 hypothetical protein CLAFUW7_02991 [Fulvia fulva]